MRRNSNLLTDSAAFYLSVVQEHKNRYPKKTTAYILSGFGTNLLHTLCTLHQMLTCFQDCKPIAYTISGLLTNHFTLAGLQTKLLTFSLG
jgi:hypothetical protein